MSARVEPEVGLVPERDFRSTMTALRSAQKGSRGVSAYSVHINRPAGRCLAAVAALVGMSANAVTLLSGGLSLASVTLLAVGPRSWGTGVLVALGMLLGFALDSADGQLARLQGTGSAAGEWLDHVVDCAVKLAIHSAVLVGWYVHGERDGILLIPLGFQLTAVVLFFGGILAAKLHEHRGRAGGVQAARQGPLRSAIVLLPADHGMLCLVFLLWGWPRAFTLLYIVLFVGNVALLGAMSRNWLRELS